MQLPTPPPKDKRQCTLQLSHEEWQDNDTQALTTTPAKKNTEEGDHITITVADKQLIIIPEKSVTIGQTTPLASERQIEQGQHSQFSEDEVLTLKGLPAEAFELGAIL